MPLKRSSTPTIANGIDAVILTSAASLTQSFSVVAMVVAPESMAAWDSRARSEPVNE